MFVNFFHDLKAAGVPVTLREYLTLMEAMDADLASRRVEDFYYLARAALVKDERNLDKFDRVFGTTFKGLEFMSEAGIEANIPEEWLKKLADKFLTEEEKAQIKALGGLDKLMETLKQRLAEQKGRHQGGSKWIGTGGTSPFGNGGYNPEGIRIGGESTHRRAVKVWDKREFKDLDDQIELGTRNIKVALRRLRKFARTGTAEELDLDSTIQGTAHKGYLDIHMRPERHNAVKVLLFFDIGGSMDWHIKATEELFSAARTEFKHMEHFYFHNCLYEKVWRENRRRFRGHDADLRRAAYLPARLQGDLRRRRLNVALRDRGAGRLGRAFQRRGGRGVDRARAAQLSLSRVAQPGAGARMGLHSLDRHGAAAHGRADVSFDTRWARPRDAGVGEVAAAIRPHRREPIDPAFLDRGCRYAIVRAK